MRPLPTERVLKADLVTILAVYQQQYSMICRGRNDWCLCGYFLKNEPFMYLEAYLPFACVKELYPFLQKRYVRQQLPSSSRVALTILYETTQDLRYCMPRQSKQFARKRIHFLWDHSKYLKPSLNAAAMSRCSLLISSKYF